MRVSSLIHAAAVGKAAFFPEIQIICLFLYRNVFINVYSEERLGLSVTDNEIRRNARQTIADRYNLQTLLPQHVHVLLKAAKK